MTYTRATWRRRARMIGTPLIGELCPHGRAYTRCCGLPEDHWTRGLSQYECMARAAESHGLKMIDLVAVGIGSDYYGGNEQ